MAARRERRIGGRGALVAHQQRDDRDADDREAEADDEDRVVAPGRGREQAEGQQRAEHRAGGVHRAVHAEGGAERLGVRR